MLLYKMRPCVVIEHRRVRQFGTADSIHGNAAAHNKKSTGQRDRAPLDSRSWRGATLRQTRRLLARPKEAMMELRTRLNVLAAIMSFAFLTAVVFGMF